jgi:hypothetical protein
MVLYDSMAGTIEISDKFDLLGATGSSSEAPRFDSIGDEYVLTFPGIEKVECFDLFEYDTLGLTSVRYLNTFYRVSLDGNAYSEWFPLQRRVTDFPVFEKMDIEIKWVRDGSSSVGTIRLLEYSLTGKVERNLIEDSSIIKLSPGESAIQKAPYIYKVFRLDGFEVVTGSDLSSSEMKWRYSQDNSRTWSKWEPLTEANVKSARITPIRFFQVEFSIENKGASSISVQDINLLGDFQNVSKDYYKSNLMGIREGCASNIAGTGYFDQSGNFIPAPNPSGSAGGSSAAISGNSCQTDQSGSSLPAMSNENKAGLYNPYQQQAAQTLLNKLSDDAQQIFGHQVIYFATDPDRMGADYTLHEYQLYNVACKADMKVSVEGNNFPDSQIVMNQFDLNLFSTMEVHITKKQFKEVFGPHRRPAKEDFIYFCNLNRMYSVDHSQQFRNFNNSAVYYKLILKKFNMASNISMADSDIRSKIKDLVKNSSLDELMGLEKTEDKQSIANKEQLKVLSRDPIRHSYAAKIVKELVENSSNIISKSHYDLSSVSFGEDAVVYKNMSPEIKESDSFGYMVWFSINNYVTDDVYGIFDYYDSEISQGWKVSLCNDAITFKANADEYIWDLMGDPTGDVLALEEDVWYCYVLNVDQRQGEVSQWIYKRSVSDESMAGSLNSTILTMVYSDSREMERFSSFLEKVKCKLVGSDMKATNVRLFEDVIPEDSHNKILNQGIIGNDSRHLIFADNANTRIVLPSFPMND